jgi:DUF1365 family protein
LEAGDAQVLHGDFAKELHVSPFMSMDQHYTWSSTRPDASNPMLSVHIASEEGGAPAFDATLKLERRPFTRRTVMAHPAATLRVLALIYAHALVLGLKRVPVHARPTPVSEPHS